MHMSIFRITGFVAGLFVMTATLSVSAHAGAPRPVGDLGFDPEIGSLYHKEKVRQQTNNNGVGVKNNAQSEDCGTISINNNQQQPNNRAGQRPGKPNVTIITGPVVNAANCR